jgi:hypothetical protein
LLVSTYTDTEIVYTFGSDYSFYALNEGDSFTVHVAGATYSGDVTYNVAATPLPATLPLFASGLGALGLLGWSRKRKARVSLLGAA